MTQSNTILHPKILFCTWQILEFLKISMSKITGQASKQCADKTPTYNYKEQTEIRKEASTADRGEI